jgi:hypothetical protein
MGEGVLIAARFALMLDLALLLGLPLFWWVMGTARRALAVAWLALGGLLPSAFWLIASTAAMTASSMLAPDWASVAVLLTMTLIGPVLAVRASALLLVLLLALAGRVRLAIVPALWQGVDGGYQRHGTRLCVADPVNSIFHRHHADRDARALPEGCASRIEGIGRPRVEPSFVPSVIDRMIAVEDAESVGAMRALSARLGRRVGGSTGTNLIACAQLIAEMAAARQTGSIVTLLCDDGERYDCTYFNDNWLQAHRLWWQDSAARILTLLADQAAA